MSTVRDVTRVETSPLVPILPVQLDINGELQDHNLRFSILAARKIDQEAKTTDGLDEVLQVAISVKHFLWPRDHGLELDDILEGMSINTMQYLAEKLTELMRLNGRDVENEGNPQTGRGSQTRSGGNSKQPQESGSGSRSVNSGSQPLPN